MRGMVDFFGGSLAIFFEKNITSEDIASVLALAKGDASLFRSEMCICLLPRNGANMVRLALRLGEAGFIVQIPRKYITNKEMIPFPPVSRWNGKYKYYQSPASAPPR